jgi:hypothetical protein
MIVSLSVLIFAHCFSLVKLSSEDLCLTLETVTLNTGNMAVSLQMVQLNMTCTNDLFSFKIGQVFYFSSSFFHPGLSHSIIINALTEAIQNVNKWRNIIQCSQHIQFLNFLVFFSPPVAYICVTLFCLFRAKYIIT